MNWKRLPVFASAAVLAGLLCVTAASAAVVDKASPYEGEYFLAYNSRSGWADDTNSGIMPTNIESDGESTESESDSDTIRISTGEDGQSIYQVEPRNLTDRISAPEPRPQLFDLREEAPPQYGDEKIFYTVDMITNEPVETLFSLRYCGENCNIWLEKEDSHGITDEMVAELGAEYDHHIHHPVQDAFGETYDRNGDGKMAIFLYDIQDGYNGTSVRSYVGGFFMPADLVRNTFNNMDVLHIDTYPSIKPWEENPLAEVKSTMIHELQHLIEESACIEPDPFHPGQIRFKYESLPTWVNEGLSMAAEHMFYGTLDSRIDYYNSWDYHINTPLADWENGDDLSHYALSYLFVQYLRTQTKDFTGGGEALYKYIIQSPKRSALCVENAMKQFYPYISLNDIFRNFYIAMVLKEPTGLYGFGGEEAFDAVEVKIYDRVSSVYLGPGAGIVSKMSSGSYTPDEVSGSPVRYVGFKTSDTTAVDMPLANLTSGKTFQYRTLNLSCAERNATMYYTVDGSEPTAETGLIYNGKPIQLLSDTDLKAVTVTADGQTSQVMHNQYTIVKEDVELFRRTLGMDMAYREGHASWVDTYTAVAAPDGDIIQIATATSDAFGGGEFSELDFPDNKAYRVLVVSKYGQDGTLKWNRTISGGWWLEVLDSIALNDGFIVTGGGLIGNKNDLYIGDLAMLPPPGPDESFYFSLIAKLNWDGTIQWINAFPNKKNDIYPENGTHWVSEQTSFVDTAICPDGGIVAVGYANYYSNSTNGGITSPNNRPASEGGDGDALITKVDSQGNLLWEKVLDGDWVSSFRGVAVLDDGTIVAAGFVDPNAIGTGDWADCPPVERSMHAVPVAVGFDQEGGVLWIKTFPYGNEQHFYCSFGDIIAVENGFVATGSFDGRFQADKNGCECLWYDDSYGYRYAMTLTEDGILVQGSTYIDGTKKGTMGFTKYYFNDENHEATGRQFHGSNYFPNSSSYETYSLISLGGRKYAASGCAWWTYNEQHELVLDPHSFLMIFYDNSIPFYTVSGNVGLPGVSIGGKLSDSQGNYTVRIMEGETVTLTPSLDGYAFAPASRTVGPVTEAVDGVDFTPIEIKYTVSGTVLDSDGAPLAGVPVAEGVVTGEDGKYSFQVRPGVNVVLTPVLEGKAFEPASRTITGISKNAPNQDFRVPRPKFKVSGTITRDGVGQGNVSVGGVLTRPDGRYEIVVEQGTDLTLTPQFFRYAFTPAAISLTDISADTPDQNFAMDLAPAVVLIATPQPLDFGSAKEGYTPVAAQSVTVRNIGSDNCSGLRIELPENSCFIFDTHNFSESLGAGGSTTFTVKPKDGLTVGSYFETITITDGENTLTIAISFAVETADDPDPDDPEPDDPDPDDPDPDDPGPDDPDTPDPDAPDAPGGDDDGDDDDPSGGSSGGGGSGGTSSRPSKPAKPSTPESDISQKPARTVIHTPYIYGYDDGSVRPEFNLTRGQCAAILSRLMGGFEPERDYGKLPFPDVRADAWYYDHIAYMTTRGLIKGYPDGTFRPDEPISRAEFSILVRNALRLENASECSFPDVQTHWAINPIGQLTQAGILDGYPDGTFRPDAPISRAEAVKVLNGAYHRSPIQSDLDRLKSPFTDLYPSHWAYYDILEAALEHKHTVK